MAREKKNGRKINMIIDQNVYNRLKYYSEEKGQTITMAVERILDKYFDDIGLPKEFREDDSV